MTEQKKKNILRRILDKICRKSAETVDYATHTVESVAGKTADAIGEVTGKAMSTAASVGNKAGKAWDSATEMVGQGIDLISKSVVNTSKFLSDAKYRNEVAYPWIQSVLRENWARVTQEWNESHDMLMILWKYSKGYTLTEKEKADAKEQLGDLIKIIPALAIFALPGGAILLPLLAKALPWDLMPSAFRQKVTEQYGKDAFKSDLAPEEKIPVDEGAILSEEVTKKAHENIQQVLSSEGKKENSVTQ